MELNKYKLGDIGEIRMCKRILKSQTSTRGDIPFYKIGTFGKEADTFINKDLFDTYLKSATIIQYTIKGRFMSR